MEEYKKYKQKLVDFLDKYRVGIGVFLIFFILFWGIFMMVQGASAQKENVNSLGTNSIITQGASNIEAEKSKDLEPDLGEIVFDIEGGVNNPGVYRLSAGSVIVDAINIAGGFSADADRDRVAKEMNQASLIGNNSKIYVFRKQDKDYSISLMPNQNYLSTSPQSGITGGADNINAQSGEININTGSLSDLDSLPGIGPAIGQRIIDWREANGGFEVVEDLKKVKGIGDSIFDSIKNLIAI